MVTGRKILRGMVLGLLGLAWPAFGQTLPKPGPLLPGEGLVICTDEAPPFASGDTASSSPLGDLARLPWLRLLGTEWGSQGVGFRCTGGNEPFPCGGPKGHGKVDLEGALRKGCDRALVAWASASLQDWQALLGPDIARMQLLEVFAPFLGHRLPAGPGLPALDLAWFGRGDLLQASPAELAAWLQSPLQMELLPSLQRYWSGYFVDFKVLFGKEGWWILRATAAAGGGAAGTRAWVLAGHGDVLVVLRLPSGRGEAEGLARLKAILGVQ